MADLVGFVLGYSARDCVIFNKKLNYNVKLLLKSSVCDQVKKFVKKGYPET